MTHRTIILSFLPFRLYREFLMNIVIHRFPLSKYRFILSIFPTNDSPYFFVNILNSRIIFWHENTLNKSHGLISKKRNYELNTKNNDHLTKHDFPTPPEPKTQSLYSETGILSTTKKQQNAAIQFYR